jgi:cytochrome c oxidase subunit 2
MSGSSGSIFDPASPEARAITHLFVITLWICAVIFSVVAGLVGYCLARYRQREETDDPAQTSGNKRLEVVWTVVPFCIVLALFGLTARAMEKSDPAPESGEPDLVITGHQWWWEIRSPKLGYVTANEFHIPVGERLSVRLDSTDVLHEFWVPRLTRKMTAVPHAGNHVWLRADQPGVYQGVCSEFCGTQHAWMRLIVVAEPREKFDAWLRNQKRPAADVTTGDAARGRDLFRELTCVNCHAIQGVGGKSNAGPDLTHLAGRQLLGAGVVANTPENLRLWLTDPQQIKPGALMPNFNLSPSRREQLLAYFSTLQ